MAAPEPLLKLVERFRDNLDAYKRGAYNETAVRREFLDPLFKALGWDVDNRAGYAEQFKQVVHEDALKVGGTTKAPDYSFRIGGRRVFFVEAKKPSVDVKNDPHPAYQLRRYAWSAKLPVSILSDFEEFAVYDCRIKPKESDKAGHARLLYLTFDQYADRWEELQDLFGPASIQRGALDRFMASKKPKRGTMEVDKAFLAEIERWREVLARNIYLRNPELSQRDLNRAVQLTIDRIIFLRICEDRGIEDHAALQGLTAGGRIYPRLVELFRKADNRYNSGLFHFQGDHSRPTPADRLTPGLTVDDKVLKEIITGLYYPASPYEFSVLPSDILGQVYEQFLGKVIVTTAARARVEEKPEVRKAGGVYYTPTYIVDYIVKNTVGRLVEGKKPSPRGGVSRLRILDPACGSGSFLLGAFQYLLDWHLKAYSEDDKPETWATGGSPRLVRAGDGSWRLTIDERKRILLNNIYGVDIDPQAVEVTKLSLLLKVLEGEDQESLDGQLSLYKDRALPDLGDNIKCGNSLIGSDFFHGRLALPGDEEYYKVNPLDWDKEFFDIMQAGGFDAVIGNPPYVRQETIKEFKPHLANKYHSYSGGADLYVYFLERSLSLLREKGFLSFIVSRGLLHTTYAEMLRRHVKRQGALISLVDFDGLTIFENAKDTYTCIPLFAIQEQPESIKIIRVDSDPDTALNELNGAGIYWVPKTRLQHEVWLSCPEKELDIVSRLSAKWPSLGVFLNGHIFSGIKFGYNKAFVLPYRKALEIETKAPEEASLLRPALGGMEIRRYRINSDNARVIAIPSGWTRKQFKDKDKNTLAEREAWNLFTDNYPHIAAHLAPHEEHCRKRQDQGEFWWELRPCSYYAWFEKDKIVYPDICKHPRFYLDNKRSYLKNTAYMLGSGDPYLLALLNSKLFWFLISHISIPFGVRAGKIRYRLIYQYMERVPIRTIDPNKTTDKNQHNQISELAQRMLGLHERLPQAQGHDHTLLQRQIEATDQEIDRLVYELYGLSEEEISTVEEYLGG